jgi:5-methylcytosine-specific restriction enzyme subunit McrC
VLDNRILELTEELETEVSIDALTLQEAIALREMARIEVDLPNALHPKTYLLRSRGWVGHIPASQRTIVSVVPKTPITNVFGMLEIAYDLKDLKLFDGITFVNQLKECFDSLAGIFSRKVVDRARKGLYRAYISIDEELSTVRGRLNACRTALNVGAGRPQLRCEYEENTVDVTDNRILLATLNVIARQGVSRIDALQSLRNAWRALSGTISLTSVTSSDCVGRSYNRLNDDYRTLHGMCRFFLDHAGPAVQRGAHGLLPFAIDMPRLFERCVAAWLSLYLPEHVAVSEQFKAILSGGSGLVFKMDLVLKSRTDGRVLAVLDTKYKLDSSPSTGDVAQVVAYATELSCYRAILVYPMNLTQSFVADVGPVRVTRASFDTQLPPNLSGHGLLRQLRAEIPGI